MLCVNKRWAWRDNKKLQDVKTVRKAGKFSTSGSCFVGGSTVNMFIDSQQGRDGFYQVDGKVTIAPAQELARCLWGFDFDIHDSEIVVDGRRVKVKPDGKKGIVFYAEKVERILARTVDNSEMEILANGAKVMVEYNGKDKGKVLS